ncbi:hypothetical protein [Actinoplanes sp. NPDC049802]|uniref:hypothetical protein n=1 Tax=Actinoplanes sp. NPDC049802 TaxID=3154742 RepID=UPI0033EB39F6
MRKVRLATAIVVTAVVAGGCAQGVERVGGAAAPDGVLSTSPSVSATASASPSVSSSASASSSPTPRTSKSSATALVLGPNGMGKIELGMTVAEAEATGLITGYHVENYLHNCGVADFKAGADGKGGVYFTPNGVGLSNIYAYGKISTPQGIRLGSGYKAVMKAYPDFRFSVDDQATEGNGVADTPGNRMAHYSITIDDGLVTVLGLAANNQLCEE